jgi:Flp pilus assembly protein TadD
LTSAPAFELLLSSGEGGGDEALAESAERPGTETLAAMRRAAEAHPEDPDYWFMLGGALSQRGEHEAAVGAFREALRFPTAEPSYRRSLGRSLWQLGRFEQARDAFDEALRDHPEDAEAANGLALSLLRLGRPREALRLLRRITPESRERADWRSNLGIAEWAAGEERQAERSFRSAIRSQPREPAFHRNLGLVLLARGKAARAAACFREALRIDPTRAATVMDLGDALFAAGRHAEAEAAYERGLALEPGVTAARPATQAAWQAIRLERARGELRASVDPGFVDRAMSWGFDVAHRLERWLDALGSPGRRLASVGVLLLLVLFGRVTLVVLPHYVAHYRLHDEVVRLSRMPTEDDALVRQGVLEAVRRLGRAPYVRADDVRVVGAGATRRVTFGYEVKFELLPGLTPRLRFRIHVEEPFFVERVPVVL